MMPQIGSRWHSPATRWGRRVSLAILVGIAAGAAAALLDRAIHFGSDRLIGRFTHFGTADFFHFEWAILLLPALGGLVSGLLVYLGAPRSTGHGVDVLTRAFHRHFGHLPIRGPGVKGAGAAIVISTGGSAGPEGPIAALGAALGSTIARFFPLTAQERRILLIGGCAAGIGAIFRCPLGGALFATSILYSEPEFESDAIVPSFVASVIGYSTYMTILGSREPMIVGIDSLLFTKPADLPWYAILGFLCGLTSIVFFFCLRAVERGIVPRSRIPRWFLPALGGLGTGAIACLLPQVMDGRYLFIQNAVDGGLFDLAGPVESWAAWAALFGLVALAKCVATALTVGSGAPGGVLGPSVFIGGAVGACVGAIGHTLFPEAFPDELRRALIPVGMAAVLAATMRIPLAAIVMTGRDRDDHGDDRELRTDRAAHAGLRGELRDRPPVGRERRTGAYGRRLPHPRRRSDRPPARVMARRKRDAKEMAHDRAARREPGGDHREGGAGDPPPGRRRGQRRSQGCHLRHGPRHGHDHHAGRAPADCLRHHEHEADDAR
jgi:CIC family chloride channel protein